MTSQPTEAPPEFEETRDRQGAFPRLGDDIVAALEEYGARRATNLGDVLFADGDPTYDFFVVLSGKVAIVQNAGCEDERTIGVHGERRFLGELNLFSGEAVYVTARVIEAGEVLQVPRRRLMEFADRESRAPIRARTGWPARRTSTTRASC